MTSPWAAAQPPAPAPAPRRPSPLVWILVSLLAVSLLGLVALFAWPRDSGPTKEPTLVAPPVTGSYPTQAPTTTPPAAAAEPQPLAKSVADTKAPSAFGAWGPPTAMRSSGPTLWQASYTSPAGTAIVSALRDDDIPHALAGTADVVDGPHTRCGRAADDVRCAIALADGIVLVVLPAGTGTTSALEASNSLLNAL